LLGIPPEDSRFRPPAMPAWIFEAEQIYGIPDIENRGFKLALDSHGPPFNPDTGERIVTPDGIRAIHAYLAKRFPLLRTHLLSRLECASRRIPRMETF
jgi:hypothetical protein